ncbi:glycogen synthase GlgA [Sutcliffiella sp. NC1]|uniref:glycogen synthase GlgA n=1 Tax=Sutcliffiella sp. NC1 TaxID=3004096 RepID=UPI0022DE4C6A|nr:glycogen synthase GlgA [Sutcliffiella sp. NC1]WBL14243.1 glycogen synthase GlgA [Sutcliffiella sp. NC1]
MNVLFVVSECVPFVKSGGLGDVSGALPKELKNLGTDVRVILPKYGQISPEYKDKMENIGVIYIQVGWRRQYCGIERLIVDDVTYYFIDNEYYFNRDSLYGHFDDGERFSFFCRAVLEIIPVISFIPEVIHCHDWHTGMVNFLLENEYKYDVRYKDIKTVFTIHNLQFQGIFPQHILGDLLGLDNRYFTTEQLEFYGNVNFMKAALVSSHAITTVSPTYKNEIQTEFFGERLDGVLREKSHLLEGIVNGIDEEVYNPLNDPVIVANYSVQHTEPKYVNKQHLQKICQLPIRPEVPVISMVSRLTKQKGLDLVKHVFHEVLEEDVQFIVLGTGEDEFEQFFRQLAAQYPQKVKVVIGFNEDFAHQIYAGADCFLMPSKFEPCGLGQLIAMRYGTIPIVRETGGLNDTVFPYNEEINEGNGFSFTNYNAHDMLFTIRRAISLYKEKEVWNRLVKNAMSRDYSWASSAFKYNKLYSSLSTRRNVHVLE